MVDNLQIKGMGLYLQKRGPSSVYMLRCLLGEVAKMEKIRSLVFLHCVAVTEKEFRNGGLSKANEYKSIPLGKNQVKP